MLKKFISAVLTLAVLIAPAVAEPALTDTIDVSAPSAILMEKTTGTVIYEKDSHKRLNPASVTKVMTMLLIMEAMENGDFTADDTVIASARAASFGGSCVYLEEGEKMSVREMLKCIAVVSANDCAVAMAEYMCGTEQAFVDRMNARASELGLKDTHFTTCTGLFEDPEHYTSAYDMAVMSRELIRHEEIKEYTTIWMDSIRNGEFGLSNTNKLVYYYEGCTGLKTGYTNAAMYCLSATAQRDGVEYIAVILHADTIESRNNDAKTLLNYGFANYTLCPLRASYALAPIPVELGEADSVQPVYSGPEALLVPKQGAANIEYKVDIAERVTAPVSADTQLGTLTVTQNGEELAVVPITAAAPVARQSCMGIFLRLCRLLAGAAG